MDNFTSKRYTKHFFRTDKQKYQKILSNQSRNTISAGRYIWIVLIYSTLKIIQKKHMLKSIISKRNHLVANLPIVSTSGPIYWNAGFFTPVDSVTWTFCISCKLCKIFAISYNLRILVFMTASGNVTPWITRAAKSRLTFAFFWKMGKKIMYPLLRVSIIHVKKPV